MARYGTKLKPKAKSKHGLLPLWLALAGLGLVLIAVWGALASAKPNATIEVKGAPSLKVETERIDRGNVKLGVPVRDDIRVTNVGDKPLRFVEAPYIEIKEGCWPPTPTIGSMVLQPGQSTVVSMEYMMHGDMGGKHDFRLQLKTNDPAQPTKEVQILSNWVQ